MRRHSLLLTALTAALAVGVMTPLHTTVVMGQSMVPTLHSGGLYPLDTSYYRSHPVSRGDIVVFRYQGETCTKRVYAVPGDRLVLLQYPDGDGTEVVKPSELEAYQRLERSGHLTDRWLSELIVPTDQYFVLGDNEDVSWDSRAFGCVPRSAIIGRLTP